MIKLKKKLRMENVSEMTKVQGMLAKKKIIPYMKVEREKFF